MVSDALAEIAPEVDAESVGTSADLRQAPDLDSMHFLNLIAALCPRTARIIPGSDYAKLFSLAGMALYFAD